MSNLNISGATLRKIFISCLLGMSLCSCASQTFQFGDRVGLQETPSQTQVFWFGGLRQVKEIDVSLLCKGAENVARVELSTSLSQFIFTIMTLGVYSPRQVDVRCFDK